MAAGTGILIYDEGVPRKMLIFNEKQIFGQLNCTPEDL